MKHSDDVVIVAAKRTALGRFLGQFQDVPASELCAQVIQNCVKTTQLDAHLIDEAFIGCVLPAGQGQAPARQAVIKAGLPQSVGATTVNKVCGSGMKSVMLAYDAIVAQSSSIVLAGGMENMSAAPYLMRKVRAGARIGHTSCDDHMFFDGLEDAYTGRLMGSFAEDTAQDMAFSRKMQDDFALSSLARAKQAITEGAFKEEIVPVQVKTRQGEVLYDTDESPHYAKPEKISQLKPAFAEQGTLTAANSSSIADGASVLLLMSASSAQKHQLTPLATLRAHATYSTAPAQFTSAPVGAIELLLSRTGWSLADVDLFEINEAFAMVTMLAIEKLQLDEEKVNIFGGACALGHPIGCTGARILVTLIHALKQKGLNKGIASLCIGGGEATAVAIEVE